MDPWGSQGGPGRSPRHVLGAPVASQEPILFLGRAPATSQGALGKVDQVHWGPFWGVLDLQKYGQGFNLDGKTGVILTIPFFAPSDFWKVPRRSQERVRRPKRPPRRSQERGRRQKRRPRGAQGRRAFLFGAQGGTKSEQASKSSL